jgi:hypothetical protein
MFIDTAGRSLVQSRGRAVAELSRQPELTRTELEGNVTRTIRSVTLTPTANSKFASETNAVL